MKFPDFDYRAPASLDEALDTLAALGSDAKVLAGGQSLLPTMRYGLARPAVLVDLKRVPALRGRQVRDDGISFGAMTTHADLARGAPDTPLASLLAAHAAQIAFPAVRTQGTVGGSLVHADPAGDWPLLFSALNAAVELRSLRGRRAAALRDFIQGPLTTEIEIDELLTSIMLDADHAGLTAWGRAKLMHRAGEYAATSAVALRRASGQWSCWIMAPSTGPRAAAGCAALLDAASPDSSQPGAARPDAARPGAARPDTARLMRQAMEDIARMLPDEPAVAHHRHAANLVRAIEQAREYRHD
ncbi:FAD-binding PCMH-type domain-containing protein [Bordetella sputigena]|uniref:FAD binding domain-containing protein n=1 Tax=Bordetella sputigena TaxID=1416810 RepID=UPI0039F087BF